MGFAAVNTGNNLLFLIVSGLLAFMSVTGLAGMLNLKKLTPELLAPAEIYAGSPTPFRLRVHNGKRYLPSFLIRLECPNGQGGTIPVLPAGAKAECSVGLTFPTRGRVDIGKLTVSSCFPVNFFKRYWHFSLDSSCLVFPRLLPGRALGDGDDRRRFGPSSGHVRGLDGELERIAGYSGREPRKMIHWKLSARGDELLVKEFGSQSAPPLLIDLETLPGPSLEERLCRAAWLVKRWTPSRPVGLKLAGRTIPAAAGPHHCLRLLTELALYGN